MRQRAEESSPVSWNTPPSPVGSVAVDYVFKDSTSLVGFPFASPLCFSPHPTLLYSSFTLKAYSTVSISFLSPPPQQSNYFNSSKSEQNFNLYIWMCFSSACNALPSLRSLTNFSSSFKDQLQMCLAKLAVVCVTIVIIYICCRLALMILISNYMFVYLSPWLNSGLFTMPGSWYILSFYFSSTLIRPLGHAYWKWQLCWMFR